MARYLLVGKLTPTVPGALKQPVKLTVCPQRHQAEGHQRDGPLPLEVAVAQ